MAGDKEISFKVSIDPFQEMDKKKSALMFAKEVGLKKLKRVDIPAKFVPTTKKWDKRKLEAQTRVLFRYDLALFASQVWQAFAPIQKAKNGQDTKKLVAAFLKAVPKLQKGFEKNIKEKLEDFQDEIASGATDDAGVLKATRKSLTAGHPDAMMTAISKFFDEFEKSFDSMAKLKKTELRSSGEKKEEAAEELEAELKKQVPDLLKKLAGLSAVLKKRVAVMSGIPAAMKKSMNKDMSDAAKDEFKKSLDLLAKAISPVESQVVKFNKVGIATFQKLMRKDIGSSVYNTFSDAATNLLNPLTTLEDLMAKTDAKLKKLEQTAKKR